MVTGNPLLEMVRSNDPKHPTGQQYRGDFFGRAEPALVVG
jgi:hypothetical protein